MNRILELITNRDYKPAEGLHPAYGFILFFFVPVIWGALILFGGETYKARLLEGDTTAIGQYIQLPLFIVCVLFMLIVRMKFSDLKLKPPRLLDIALALMLAILGFLTAFAIAIIIGALMMILAPDVLKNSMDDVKVMENLVKPEFWHFAQTLLFMALFPALVEEFLYRGLIMESFMKWGPFWAVLVSGILFGVSHETPIRIPSLIIVGVLLGWLKYRTGNLTISIIMHFIYNAGVLWLTLALQGVVPEA